MSSPRIGLIGRPESHRGLGVQTQEFARHIDCKRILQINFPTHTGPRNPAAFNSPIHVDYNVASHTLDARMMADFLDGLDVVFTAETPYDWSMIDLAREMGVKTVIQGNPEFLRHGQAGYDHYSHPDAWWWPTTWRLTQLPPGEVVPVPMPDVPNVSAPPNARLRILHVAGKRAHGDRNGTDLFVAALRYTTQPMDVTITSVDEEPIIVYPQQNLNLEIRTAGYPNRWQAYENRHVLVLPRRYGGLCLPALEAMASGLAVMMPPCSPNGDWPILPMSIEHFDEYPLAAGPVPAAKISPIGLAHQLDMYAQAQHLLTEAGQIARSRTLWWEPEGTDLYLDRLEEIVES